MFTVEQPGATSVVNTMKAPGAPFQRQSVSTGKPTLF